MQSLRVVHVVDDFSATNSGVAFAVRNLACNLGRVGIECSVVATGEDSLSLPDGAELRLAARSRRAKGWCYSTQLNKALGSVLTPNSIVHVHGVWMAPQLQAIIAAEREGLPLLLTPHNMLGGWLWQRDKQKQLKKTLYLGLLRHWFARVRTLHALSPMEAQNIEQILPRRDVHVIPNGIETPEAAEGGVDAHARYFLYLGRLYEGKGLELLIDAFAQLNPPGFRLVIAGTGEASYTRSLQERVRERGIDSKVEFPGYLSGVRKQQAYGRAWAGLLPSFSEGISVVALETLAANTPLITSHYTGMSEVSAHGGLLVDTDVAQLRAALSKAASWSLRERSQRGALARSLVLKKYDWTVVAKQYAKLYRYLWHSEFC